MGGSRERGSRWWKPRKESGSFCVPHVRCEPLDLRLRPQVPAGYGHWLRSVPVVPPLLPETLPSGLSTSLPVDSALAVDPLLSGHLLLPACPGAQLPDTQSHSTGAGGTGSPPEKGQGT